MNERSDGRNGAERVDRGLEVAARERRAPGLAVSVFGPFSASWRGKPIEIKLRKGAAVLGYLCLQENLTARRDRLAFLLWSESDNNSARTSLRQTLISLRRAFRGAGFNGFKTTKSTVSLDLNSTDIDFKRVVGATNEGRIDEALFAVERLPETLLEGMEELDEEFRMWLLPTRQALHNRLERVLSAQLNDSAASEPSKVLVARALLRIDPTNEAALHHEVLSFAQRGDFIGALRLYRRFETLLATDYDLKPSAELQMLVARIQKEGAGRDATPAESRLEDETFEARPERRGARHTIVIRLDPFAVQGVDLSQGYLITGFRHALTASLVRFREWIIVDGAQDTANNKPEYDYALQATLYEVDGAIGVVLTLLRLQDSAYIWSQIVRLQLDKWLATQHEIIRGIASKLQVHISAERLSRSFDRGEISATAFDQWLRAQAAAFSLQGSRLQETRQSLISVARSNPTYSPLFSALAQFDNVESLLRPGVFRSPEVAQSAVENARRAVQLDAVDSRAHLALGWAYAFKWDFEAAMPHMRLAVELNESDPWPHISAALFWALAHHGEMASESLASFSSRSKAHTGAETGYLAQIHFLNGEFALAVSVFERKELVLPIDLAWTTAALALSDRVAEAQERAREFIGKAQVAWAGPLKPTEENVVSWLMHAHPFRHFPHWTTMREGLERAGLPVRHLVHALYFGADHRQ
jgi:DNA-binding SARP family transcriptional activator